MDSLDSICYASLGINGFGFLVRGCPCHGFIADYAMNTYNFTRSDTGRNIAYVMSIVSVAAPIAGTFGGPVAAGVGDLVGWSAAYYSAALTCVATAGDIGLACGLGVASFLIGPYGGPLLKSAKHASDGWLAVSKVATVVGINMDLFGGITDTADFVSRNF
jgi:hypothetical protein